MFNTTESVQLTTTVPTGVLVRCCAFAISGGRLLRIVVGISRGNLANRNHTLTVVTLLRLVRWQREEEGPLVEPLTELKIRRSLTPSHFRESLFGPVHALLKKLWSAYNKSTVRARTKKKT